MGERRENGARKSERNSGKGAGRARREECKAIGFGAVRVDGGNGDVECVKPKAILYAFTPAAGKPAAKDRKRLAIMAKWTAKSRLPSGRVCVRTREGVYHLYLRTLREFQRQVPERKFGRVSRGVVANLRPVHSINLGAQPIRTLSYKVDQGELSWTEEFVTVTKTYLPAIRKRFNMPQRISAHS